MPEQNMSIDVTQWEAFGEALEAFGEAMVEALQLPLAAIVETCQTLYGILENEADLHGMTVEDYIAYLGEMSRLQKKALRLERELYWKKAALDLRRVHHNA